MTGAGVMVEVLPETAGGGGRKSMALVETANPHETLPRAARGGILTEMVTAVERRWADLQAVVDQMASEGQLGKLPPWVCREVRILERHLVWLRQQLESEPQNNADQQMVEILDG